MERKRSLLFLASSARGSMNEPFKLLCKQRKFNLETTYFLFHILFSYIFLRTGDKQKIALPVSRGQIRHFLKKLKKI